jgi:hypothetical protein
MPQDLAIPPIPLSGDDLQARFDALQQRLIPLWKSIQTLTNDEQTIVVVPSLTVEFDLRGALLQAYEERFLFMLLLLRQPAAHLVYVTSQGVNESVVDYYLGLLPGVIASHARRRLHFVSPHDGSNQPLTVKLLQRPHLIEQIRSFVRDPHRAHLVPFNTTTYERDLALRLGIPMYGADPSFNEFGTKSGCRKLFAETGITHPYGFEDLHSLDEIVDALAKVRAERPDGTHIMVKLDEGVSGEGNAVVDVGGLDPNDRGAVTERVRAMQFEAKGMTLDEFLGKMADMGGIVEERVVGEAVESPSVQMRVTPLGAVEVLSTHDQVLSGPSGQKYLGCRFPADARYAAQITREAQKVGKRLADSNVLGRMAIDFVSTRTGDSWTSYAIELNLRKGGTTHPFLTLQFLTDGVYDANSAGFTTPHGTTKYFIASDSLESPAYRALTPDDLFDIAVRNGLHFDQTRQTGVVFHMISALGDYGRLGLTAVGNTHREADEFYERTKDVLDREAADAARPRDLPAS